MASALAYLHSQGFLHNDIKPANIMWDLQRGAVLCDFGMSSGAADTSGSGTPFYVPPEWAKYGQRGPTSDVWALGVTMLYAFSFIRLPDSYGFREWDGLPTLYWNIGKVCRSFSMIITNPQIISSLPKKIQDDIAAARKWLDFVEGIANGLNDRQPLFATLKRTLDSEPNQRLSAQELDSILSPVESLTLNSLPSPPQPFEPQSRAAPPPIVRTPFARMPDVHSSIVRTPAIQSPRTCGPASPSAAMHTPAMDTQRISSETFSTILNPPYPRGDTESVPSEAYAGYARNSQGSGRIGKGASRAADLHSPPMDTQRISSETFAAILNPSYPRGDTESVPSEAYAGCERNSQGSSRKGKERQSRCSRR